MQFLGRKVHLGAIVVLATALDHGPSKEVDGQALILGSIPMITGIPATEAQALHSKGDACCACQARVPKLIPFGKRP